MAASFLIFLKNSTVCEENVFGADHWGKAAFGVMATKDTCYLPYQSNYRTTEKEFRS